MEIFEKMTSGQKKWWHNHCDPSVYLKNTEMPMLFVSGTNDFAYPLDSLRKSCQTAQGKVQTCIRLEMDHGHIPGWAPQEIEIYADSILKDGPALPSIEKLTLKDNKVNTNYSSNLPVKAFLLYTCDNGAWMHRKWHRIEATVDRNKVTGKVPDGATVCLLAIEDSRGAYTSSLPEIIHGVA